MAWWYEIRDSMNRLVEMRRGFPTQAEAQEVGNALVARFWTSVLVEC